MLKSSLKTTRINPFSFIYGYLTRSIRRLVMITFGFLLLLPIVFLIPSMNQDIWKDVQQDNLQKNLLLAKSLAEPIKLYLQKQRQQIQSFSETLPSGSSNEKSLRHWLKQYQSANPHLVSLSFLPVNASQEQLISSIRQSETRERQDMAAANFKMPDYIDDEIKYNRYDTFNTLSAVFKSTYQPVPVILFRHHVESSAGEKLGTLLIESDLSYFQEICNTVSSGTNGHCVIIDDKHQVVSHPDSDWVKQSRKLPGSAALSALKSGESILQDFALTTNEQGLIAGVAPVKEPAWGVLVYQPKQAIDMQFRQIKTAILTSVVAGAIVALLFAYLLTRLITKPLNTLVMKSREIDVRSDSFKLGEVPKGSPVEIKLLWNTISTLIDNFQESNAEVKKLNYSLKNDIRKVAAKLRENNQYLNKISNIDHITEIANRSCLKREIDMILRLNMGERIGLLLADIDNFKYLNEYFGQEAGDKILRHVARIMHEETRNGDVAARYGNDEFAVCINNCSDQSLYTTAKKLSAIVEQRPVTWNGEKIAVTLSIGIISQDINSTLTVERLLKYAEYALYLARLEGPGYLYPYQPGKDESKGKQAQTNEPADNVIAMH